MTAGTKVCYLVTLGFSLPTLPSANFIVGEMKNVDKNLPRVIHSSMGITTVRLSLPLESKGVDCGSKFLFLLANVSYFLVLDKVSTGFILPDPMPESSPRVYSGAFKYRCSRLWPRNIRRDRGDHLLCHGCNLLFWGAQWRVLHHRPTYLLSWKGGLPSSTVWQAAPDKEDATERYVAPERSDAGVCRVRGRV